MQDKPITSIPAILAPELAQAFAQFLDRVSLEDYEGLGFDVRQAWRMLLAGQEIGQALARIGYAPR